MRGIESYHVLSHNICAQRVEQAAFNLNNFSASIHFLYFHFSQFSFCSGEISEEMPGRRCKTKTSPNLLPPDLRDPEVLQIERDQERVKAATKEQSKVRWTLPFPCALSIMRMDHGFTVPHALTASPYVSGTNTMLTRQQFLDFSVFRYKIQAQQLLLPSSPLIPHLLWQRDEYCCSSATVLLGFFKTPECPT